MELLQRNGWIHCCIGFPLRRNLEHILNDQPSFHPIGFSWKIGYIYLHEWLILMVNVGIYIYHNYDPMGKDGRKPSISAKAMCFLLFFAKKDLERLRTPKQR